MKRRPDTDTDRRVVLIGGGVHAVVLADAIRTAGQAKLMGYVDCEGHDPFHMQSMKVPNLGTDQQLEHLLATNGVNAALLAIAGLEHSQLRPRIAERLQDVVPTWHIAIHPDTTIAESATLADGTVVLPQAVINPLARIGRHVVINTSAVIEHHCQVDDFAVISPQVTLCGSVHINSGAFIGAGAVILGRLTIGANAVVGAGSVVIKDVPAGAVVAGNPGRLMSTSDSQRSDLLLAATP